ncbi:DUF1697 domain-containing protein [Maritalea porphyrae]|uniref:DUF1697 domain-containing protein n=1 Tax=Maritalea porphyrae TaxID=880732 RepID=UPI0022AEBC80|nr:DUF1697 domain-containing protein [Maritalea porphyrae]MCZ4271777.1 DUF1697 domain-containing protein [Maritalea porphyrae]
MNKYVALFRGLNVGGHNKIKMVDLKAMLEGADCQKVTTYIQSGNAVFLHNRRRDEIEDFLETAFENQFGYKPDIIVRTNEEIASAASEYPFFTNDRNMSYMMTGFTRHAPFGDALSTLEEVAENGELVQVTDSEIHIYFANGSGRSKLAALNFAKKIGTPITTRNRRTVLKLLEMIEDL